MANLKIIGQSFQVEEVISSFKLNTQNNHCFSITSVTYSVTHDSLTNLCLSSLDGCHLLSHSV